MQEEGRTWLHLPKSSKFLQQTGEKSIFIVKSLVHFNLTQQSQNFCYIRALLYTLCSIIRGEKDGNFWRQNIKSQHFLKFFFSHYVRNVNNDGKNSP